MTTDVFDEAELTVCVLEEDEDEDEFLSPPFSSPKRALSRLAVVEAVMDVLFTSVLTALLPCAKSCRWMEVLVVVFDERIVVHWRHLAGNVTLSYDLWAVTLAY